LLKYRQRETTCPNVKQIRVVPFSDSGFVLAKTKHLQDHISITQLARVLTCGVQGVDSEVQVVAVGELVVVNGYPGSDVALDGNGENAVLNGEREAGPLLGEGGRGQVDHMSIDGDGDDIGGGAAVLGLEKKKKWEQVSEIVEEPSGRGKTSC
jgi:hypothetical protein